MLFATLRNLEHPGVEFHELKDLDHATVVRGTEPLMPVFIAPVSKAMDAAR